MKKWLSAVVLFVLLLSACGTVSPAAEEDPADLSSPEPEAAEALPTASPSPLVIRDAFSSSGCYSDSLGNSWNYLLRIPMIDAGGEDAARLNRELIAALEPAVKDVQTSMDCGSSLVVTWVDYTVYRNGDLISILCQTDTDWGFESYYAVNFDASICSEVKRTQLLQRFGMTEESFINKAQELMEGYFLEQYEVFAGNEIYQDRHDRSVDARNFKEDCCLFVNEQGQLCMIPRLYSFAGGDYYYHIFTFG